MPMVEAKFHLFQIQEKMTAPDSIIAPQFSFGERPKTLDAVDVVSFSRELASPVVNAIMSVAVRKEAVIRAERIGIDGASLGDFLLDDEPERGTGDVRHRAGVDSAVALKQPENSDFPGGAPAAIAFTMPAEIGLVNLNLAGERRFAFTCPSDGDTDAIIDPLGAVSMDAKLAAGAGCGDFEREETDKLPHHSVRQSASFDDFMNHDSSIRKVKHLY